MFHCSYIGRNRPLLLITSCPCERLRGQGIGRINGRVTRAPACFWGARRPNNDSIRYVFTRPKIPDSRLELNRAASWSIYQGARNIAAAAAAVVVRVCHRPSCFLRSVTETNAFEKDIISISESSVVQTRFKKKKRKRKFLADKKRSANVFKIKFGTK